MAYILLAIIIACVIVCFTAYIQTTGLVVHIAGIEVTLPKGTEKTIEAKSTAKDILKVSTTYYTGYDGIRIIQNWLDRRQDTSYYLVLSVKATLNIDKISLTALINPVSIILTCVDNNVLLIYIIPEKQNAGKLCVKNTGNNKIRYNTGNNKQAGYIEYKGPIVIPTLKHYEECYGKGVPLVR